MTLSNNPPPYEAFSLHIEELFSLVSGTVAGATVETDEQEATLDGLLDDLRQVKKDANAERVAEKKPHDDAAAAVQARWKPLIERCEMAQKAIEALLTPYRLSKQRDKEAEAARLRAEAQATQEAAQAALRQSDDLEARFAAEGTLKQAKKLTAAANKADRAPTGLRTGYRAEITDMTAFARWAWSDRRSEVEAFFAELAAREARHGPRIIPGLNIITERKAA